MTNPLAQVGTTVGNVAGTASGVLSGAKAVTGALSTAAGMLSGSIGSMGGLADLSGLGGMTSLIAATLAEASFRGVKFSMATSEDEVGRRVVQMFFPGRDDFAVQDLGKLEGPIHIHGLICGDDYVYRAAQMRAALLQKGPATLKHPWWGELKVRLIGDPARIGFDENRQGIATLEMTVVREPVPAGAAAKSWLDSLTSLLNKADRVLDAATSVMQQVLAPVLLGVSLVRTVENSVAQIGAMFTGLMGSVSEPISTACSAPLAVITAGIAQPARNTGTTYADAITSALVGVPAAIADAVLPAETPAIGSARTTTTGTTSGSIFAPAAITTSDYLGVLASSSTGGTVTLTPTPQAGTALLIAATYGCLQVGATLGSTPGGSAAYSIALVAASGCLTQAISTASAITYTSTQDAISTRDALVAALDEVSATVVSAAAVTQGNGIAPAAIADFFAAIQSTRAAIFADISSRLGRLPSVVSLTLPGEMDAWVLAYALAGDTAANVVPMLNDVITRNRVLTPAILPAGTLEVLEPVP
ncbi:DNA circularization N-terminal domain-containing protein [Acetobacter persici]|uniref:DNA circularization N-terminal domain-containing protein n=1 Tax=Acetobacter persici TaxID=1076596 RepID=UPI0020CE2E19|nr:DNA circularization N-terminal domain-containing protein [Acetobacter persici]MCP9320101.1 DNA circularization N-terminal domain-containing protein [Acetobacter persici]